MDSNLQCVRAVPDQCQGLGGEDELVVNVVCQHFYWSSVSAEGVPEDFFLAFAALIAKSAQVRDLYAASQFYNCIA